MTAKTLSSRFRFPYLLGILLCCLFLGSIVFSPSSKTNVAFQNLERQEKQLIGIRNNTKSFSIVAVNATAPNQLEIILRNISDKKITAFALARGKTRNTTELGYADKAIMPDETFVKKISYPVTGNRYPTQEDIQNQITILASIFEDGTGDGDSQVVRQILDQRLGRSRQMAQIYPLMRHLMDSSDADIDAVLNHVKAQVVRLSKEPEKGESSYVEIGLHNAKEEALMGLKELEEIKRESGTSMFRDSLSMKIKDFQKLLVLRSQ